MLFYKKIRNFFHWLKAVYSYAIFLWDDYDWDHAYFLRLMRFKLVRMEKVLTNGYAENSIRVGRQVKYAIYLLDKLDSDHPNKKIEDMYDRHLEQYGEVSFDFEKISSLGKHIGFVSSVVYSKVDSNDLVATEAASENKMVIYSLEIAAREDLYDRLFAHMRKYIQHWWD